MPAHSGDPSESLLARAKARVAKLLDPDEDSLSSRVVGGSILALILANVLAFIAGTVADVQRHWGGELARLEAASVALFCVEYLLRFWTADHHASARNPRLRYVFSFYGLVDLLAIAPFFLSTKIDLRVLRAARAIRALRALKIARHSKGLQVLARVVRARLAEFMMIGAVALMVFLFSATGVFFAEHEAQPDKFTDIPAAMWWYVVTLTTVGYGDIFPVTTAGKFFATMTMLFGIALVAVPTGIIGASMTDELLRMRKPLDPEASCPTCGRGPDHGHQT